MADMGSGVVQKQVIYAQDSPPRKSERVVWIDTSLADRPTKVYDPGSDSWVSVGVTDYTQLTNTPNAVNNFGQTPGYVIEYGGDYNFNSSTDNYKITNINSEQADAVRVTITLDSAASGPSSVDVFVNGSDTGENAAASDGSTQTTKIPISTQSIDTINLKANGGGDQRYITVNEVEYYKVEIVDHNHTL